VGRVDRYGFISLALFPIAADYAVDNCTLIQSHFLCLPSSLNRVIDVPLYSAGCVLCWLCVLCTEPLTLHARHPLSFSVCKFTKQYFHHSQRTGRSNVDYVLLQSGHNLERRRNPRLARQVDFMRDASVRIA
jgi:hypothetical protein